MALPATAAPTDPITMPDDNLRACINADLGQGASDPITEAQAAAITTVDCQGEGITDITGLETMPLLETVWLNNNNGITNLDPIKNLNNVRSLSLNNVPVADTDLPGLLTSTDLGHLGLSGSGLSDISALAGSSVRSLHLTNNDIVDLSALATLNTLESLNLGNNQISDISQLEALTGLVNLYLEDNEIADVSQLSALTNLEILQLANQSLDLPPAPLGAATTNPVTDEAGNSVPVTSTDAGFSYDAMTDAWSFSAMGNKNLAWNTPVTIGTVTDVEFSGTISQRISFAQAVPEDPTVTEAVCINGDVVYPQITLPDTEGITYTIVGNVAPGETITIEAVPADDDHAVYVDPASDWVDASGDHIYATLEITLDNPDCDTTTPTVIDPPNGDLPLDDDSDQVETTGQTLTRTGGPSASIGILAVALMGIGGLLVLTGRARFQRE